jgi:ketosteroid isomerase-like protein
MSPENLERYGRMVQAWQRGDLEAWLDDAQDREMRTSGKFPGSEPVYRGRDGMRAFWDLLRAPWRDYHHDITRIQDVGGRYLALLTIRAVGRESGAEVEWKWAHVVTEENGLLR